MKKILYAIIFLIVISSALAAYPYDEKLPLSTGIRVTLLNQDPDPIDPGDYVELRFQLVNYGTASRVIEFEILPEHPFYLDFGINATKDLGPVQGMQKGDEAITLYYKLKVDESAVEGTNKIKVHYKEESYGWIEDEFDVRLQSKDAALSVMAVETEPEFLEQGKTGLLKIKIKNIADSLMRDVSFKLDLSDKTNSPFAPIDSSTENKIQKIPANQFKEVLFKLAPFPDADSGLYKIPVVITYFDEAEKKYNKSDYIAVRVGQEPNLRVTLDSTTLYAKNSVGEITVKFANIDLTDIKFLNVELMETDYLEAISSKEIYVGNVDSDDYETVTYKIYLKNIKGDSVSILLKLSYKDANNNEYERIANLELRLYSTSEAQKFGLAKSSSTTGIMLTIIIVVLGIFLYRKYRKKLIFHSR